jgi:hypothetical protein
VNVVLPSVEEASVVEPVTESEVVAESAPIVAEFIKEEDALRVVIFEVVEFVVDALSVWKFPVVPQRVVMVARVEVRVLM